MCDPVALRVQGHISTRLATLHAYADLVSSFLRSSASYVRYTKVTSSPFLAAVSVLKTWATTEIHGHILLTVYRGEFRGEHVHRPLFAQISHSLPHSN